MGVEKRFSDKEVGAIIKRAAELQAIGSGPASDGATLAQLRQAASELGLDEALIDRAVREVAGAPSSGFWTRLLGGPWEATADQVVEGTVTDAEWPALLAGIREVSGRVGYPSEVAGAFEWLSKEPDGLHVSLIPVGGQTRVRAIARFGQWIGAFYVLPILAAVYPVISAIHLFMAGRPIEGLTSVLIPLLLLVLGRVGFARLCVRKRRNFDSLVEGMTEWISTPRASMQERAVGEGLRARATLNAAELERLNT